MTFSATFTFDPEEEKPDKDFREVVNEALEVERRARLSEDRIYMRSKGYWAYWQEEKIRNFEMLPVDRYERFSLFTTEHAPPVNPGKYHLHSFYERGKGISHWKLTGPSMVCKYPGRCKKVSITMEEEG